MFDLLLNEIQLHEKIFIAVRNAAKKVVSTFSVASKSGVEKGGKPFTAKHF